MKALIIAPSRKNANVGPRDKKLANPPRRSIGCIMQKAGLLGCVVVIIVVAVIVFAIGGGSYNKLNGKSQNVDGKWAQVQTQYQRRADLIPNLVNTVKGAANFEQSTLEGVVQARASATQVKIDPSHAPTDPAQLAAYQKAQDTLSGSLSRLLVTVEKYPELRATQSFRDLQAQIEGTENRIAVARGDFNTAAVDYNTARTNFPAVLYAGLMGFKEKPPFKADESAQNAPKVDFGSFNNTPAPAPAAPATAPAPTTVTTPAPSPA